MDDIFKPLSYKEWQEQNKKETRMSEQDSKYKELEEQLVAAHYAMEQALMGLKMVHNSSPCIDLLDDYRAKYLKPKDELWEKFKTFLVRLGNYGAIDPEYMYGIFKEIFKDELNGTKAIDEAIYKMKGMIGASREMCIEEVKAIKERMNK